MKMFRSRAVLTAFAVALVMVVSASTAQARHRRDARQAAVRPWHAPYNHSMYGRPVALVVPPTARWQTSWGWGVGNTRVTPIYHQFSATYPGQINTTYPRLRRTPRWPSDTNQFGVYYIRGPRR